MYTLFIAAWGFVNLLMAAVSINKIKRNTAGCDFIWWWALPTGAFVWEDLMIFGFLHALLAGIALYLGQPILWLIFFLVFWVVRSMGETLYFFLQQFLQPKHHPHYIDSHFVPIRKIFGNISEQKCFIILQVSMQSITVLSLMGLLLIFLGY